MKKTAAVTGASSGIGYEIAKGFLSRGYAVYGLSRSAGVPEGAVHIRCDVADEASAAEAIERIAEDHEKLDVLINCAGIGISGSVEDTPLELAEVQLDVNILGSMRVIRCALPLLRRADSPIIINISSVAAVTPIAFQAYYSASKAALNALTCALKNELAPEGIRVCAVLPGDTKTGFTDSREKVPASERYRARAERSISKMEKDERQGMDPAKVALKVLSVAGKSRVRPLYVVGAFYSLVGFLAKILPVALVNRVLYEMYAK
jgi:NAD(P)-dependent dehydrogenase (short-subunit alcohol dehydrogenase family)